VNFSPFWTIMSLRSLNGVETSFDFFSAYEGFK